ncbi:MAG: ATP-binding protein [Chloroflexota bacterium]|nr:ATP-binding protein [Chloroflexota bacterium]
MHTAPALASPHGWLDLGPGWLFASIRDAVIVADAANGRIALWNPAATQLLGFELNDVVGLPLGELIHDLDATPAWETARSGGLSQGTLELFARRKLGADVCVELTLSPLQSAIQQRAYVLVVLRDVSERRQADQERLDRARQLAVHEESVAAHRRLEVLAEASRLLDASLDYEATLQKVADVAVRTLADWCIVHLLEHDGTIRWLALAHGDPAKEAVARQLHERYPSTDAVARVLRTGASELYGDEAGDSAARGANELRESKRVARAHDAEHLRMLRELDSRAVMIVPLVARGRMLGAVSLISTLPGRSYDASDLAIAEELARRCGQAIDNARLHREAQIAVKARDRFVSIASHELRTPIARIKGYAEMVLAAYTDGDLTDEMLQRSLRRIDHASDRLGALVRDLLDVSRISSGSAPVLRLRSVDLTELVREVVARYQEQLSGTGHVLLDIVGTPGAVSADPDRIEQVLTNLLDNAVKYSPDIAEIHVRIQVKARGLLLEVQDHGIGLPPAATERIFEPFSRATNAEQLQITGMGLGLFICRNIVEQHHGRIWARSDGEGAGTVMSVWLPEHGVNQNKVNAAAA